jgi:spermidine/putrescine-binding protein
MWDGYQNTQAMSPIAKRISIHRNIMTANSDPITKRGIWDIATGVNNTMNVYEAANIAQPLNLNYIPNLKFVSPKKGQWDSHFNVPKFTVWGGHPRAMPYLWGVEAITYNAKKVAAPQTIDDLLHSRFKGKLGMGDDNWSSMIEVARNLNLGNGNPGFITRDELNHLMDKLKQLKAQTGGRGIITNGYGEYPGAYARGEIWAAFPDWGPTAQTANAGGLDVRVALIKETFSWFDCEMISNSVQPTWAMYAVLNQMIDPQAQYIVGKTLGLGVVNDAALKRLTELGPGWAIYKDPVSLAARFPIQEWPPATSDKYMTYTDWQNAWTAFAAS